MINKFKSDFNFNIKCEFSKEGKELIEIIDELFLLNIKKLNL